MMTSHNSRNPSESGIDVWQNGIIDDSSKVTHQMTHDISHVKEKLRNELETRLGIESSVHISDDLSLLRVHSSKLNSIFDQNPHLVSALNVSLEGIRRRKIISYESYSILRHMRS